MLRMKAEIFGAPMNPKQITVKHRASSDSFGQRDGDSSRRSRLPFSSILGPPGGAVHASNVVVK